MSQTIVLTELLSLDGVLESPQDWNISYVEETLGADVQGELDRATGLLFGRMTYDGMAAAWPERTGATADDGLDIGGLVRADELRRQLFLRYRSGGGRVTVRGFRPSVLQAGAGVGSPPS